jgi:nucleotide-binding universal stress UspA family protein
MKVLVATDFSGLAEEAVRVGGDYARRLGARLHVLHVAWPQATTDVQSKVDRIARDVGPGSGIAAVRVAALPAAAIVRYADEHRVDLIVLGTHGRTGVSRALLGSVAERVVRTASCPVLAVPRRRRRPDDASEESDRPPARHCIVCARASDDLICEACRARIRGETLERKLRDEKVGHPF